MDIMLNRIVELIGTKHGAKKELATYLGISQNVFTAWFAGKSGSYQKYTPKIADYYGVSLDWLSGKTDIKKPASNNTDGTRIEMFKEIIGQLSEDDLAEVLRYARFRLNSSSN